MDVQHSVLIEKSKIHPNPWNPNKMTNRQQEAIAESLDEYGQVLPLIVRPHPEIPGEYQIIDGEHRFNIAGDLVYCNVLDANDVQSKKLTIVMNETRGSADKIELAQLLADLSKETDDLMKALPYEQSELEELIKLADVNWDQFEAEFEQESDDGINQSTFVTITFKVSEEVMDVINQAKDLIEEERGGLNKDVSIAWGQVIESLAADYLATPQTQSLD